MLTNINTPANKDKIAIVVVGYNRLSGLQRLLDSLTAADYSDNQDVPLVISIDCSGNEDLYSYVRNFKWPHGEKYVNIQKERLGLKKHIYQCGDLTANFKAVVLFEDDLYVSPYYFDYVKFAVEAYGGDDLIAEISLYKNESNGFAGLPFTNIQDGSDVFLMQDVSTWGQCWTAQMWKKFVQWRDLHTEEDINAVDMPERIKRWERAWSKYYLAYVISTHRHVIYPNISLTTNFNDAGEHGAGQNTAVQVSILQGKKTYTFRDPKCLTTYDIYGNNNSIPQWLGLDSVEICLDLYGNHKNNGKHFVLSTRILPYKVIESFALNMRPIEMNVKNKIKGEGIYLYDATQEHGRRIPNPPYSKNLVPYFIKDLNPSFIVDHVVKELKNKILKKFGLKK